MRIIIIIYLSCIAADFSFSQTKIPNQLIGTWESIQYKYAKEDSLDERIVLGVSPQMITIDSSGRCYIQMMFESFPWHGKIVSAKKYSSEFELKYSSNKTYIYIRTIKNNPNYFFLTFQETNTAILFKRYMNKVVNQSSPTN